MPLGQRHEDRFTLRDRDHPPAGDLGLPKIDLLLQCHLEVGMAAVLQKVRRGGHRLAVVGNLRRERRPVSHLLQRLLPVQWLEALVERESAARVLVRRQDGCVEKQPVLLRNFRRLERYQLPLRSGLRLLEPLLADQDRIAGLRLHIHRAHPVERQRLALRIELPLEGCQQRVVAKHRGLEVHRVRIGEAVVGRLVELPVAHIAADKFHVGVVGRHEHLQLAHRLAANQVVEHRAAVHDPLPDRVEVQRIHLQRQFHPIDAQAHLPACFLDAIGRLQARYFFGKKDDGDLVHVLHRSGNQSQSRGGRHADKPANGLDLLVVHPRDRPCVPLDRLVLLQSQLHQMPPLERLGEHQPQGTLAVLRRAEEVICQRGRCQLRHRVAVRDANCELPQRRVSNLKVNLGVERDLVEIKLVDQELRNGQLRQNVVGQHLQLVVAARVAVHQRLELGVVRQRGDRAGGRKAIGRELRQAVHAHRLELHGTVINQPQMASVPHRVHRHQAQRMEAHRERAQRRLRAHHEIVIGCLLTVELYHQAPPGLLFFDTPIQDVPPVDADDFAISDEIQLEGVHPPLHHAVVEVVDLPRKPRADGDVHRRLR